MSEDRKILSVTDVKLAILESDPPKLRISANGTVGSTGWENARLIPYRYFVAPQDGIWEFDFVAEDPSTELGIITTPTLTDIDARYVWDNYPQKSVKGVRVYSSTNNVTKMLDENFVMGGSNGVMTLFQDAPKSDSSKLVDFKEAEIRPGFVNNTYFLVVTGTKPYLNMEVRLIPLVYVQQPDYWGIEVVGTLPGVGLPAEADYTVSISIDGIRGTKGVEVIGATERKTLAVPPAQEITRIGNA
jgi:hypothetical protein